jgi:hypothetical protein
MVWFEDRIPGVGRGVLPEASVGVGVHGPEVEHPFWIDDRIEPGGQAGAGSTASLAIPSSRRST